MTDTLDYIVNKYKVNVANPSPIWLPLNRLTDLPQLFKELDFKSGAEVGVLYGTYSETLCQYLPDAKIYSIDPWVHYPVFKNFRPKYMYEPIYEKAIEKLSQYPNNEIIRKSSTGALDLFEDNSLDFVFIDADHRFQYVTEDIAGWSKKVRSGGIISGHDMGRAASKDFVHVRFVVPAWCAAYGIVPWFILDAHQQRSFMWVKK